MSIELACDEAEVVEPVNITPPRYYCNASTEPGSLVLKAWGRDTGNSLIKSRTPFSGDSVACSGEASTVGGA